MSIFEPIGTDKEGNQIHLVDVIENGQSDVVSDIEVSESLKNFKAKYEKRFIGQRILYYYETLWP